MTEQSPQPVSLRIVLSPEKQNGRIVVDFRVFLDFDQAFNADLENFDYRFQRYARPTPPAPGRISEEAE